MASSEPVRLDWSGLPSDVLDLISCRITTIVDYVRFRSVCTSWRSATRAKPRHLPCQFPWLTLPFPVASDVCRFFTLSDQKTHSMEIPGARGSHCCGSSLGWLAILDTSITFFLLNPLTRQRIPLPALNNICDVSVDVTLEAGGGRYVVRGRPNANFRRSFDFICRYLVNSFVLSSDPTNAGCVAMATFCDRETLAFCKPGVDSAWTTLTSPLSSFQDIIFHKGRFYTVDVQLVLYVCDVGPQARVQEFPCTGEDDLPDYIIPNPMERCLLQERRRRGELIEKVYLVEHRRGLLMVVRTYDDFLTVTREGQLVLLDYEVFQLDLSGEPPRWVELESLGDTALFLGPGCSMALSAGDFPEGCLGNCIYMGDLWRKRHMGGIRAGPDFGVLHYGDGYVGRVPCCPVEDGSIWRPSVWISPSLRDTSSWG